MKRLILIAIAIFGLHQAWQWYGHRPLARADGVLVGDVPKQVDVANAPSFAHGEFTLTPLANYAFDARVLLVSRYRFDTESSLAPLDLGVGWQRMSDTAVIEQLFLTQSSRFMFWRWQNAPPIPEMEITRSAANIHVIPANQMVERQIESLRPGLVVSVRGILVEAVRGDGWRWRSSLSRDDGGNGACELMYVESVSIRN